MSLLPTRSEFFGWPRRVSRLFIVFFVFSAALNAVLGIAYGYLSFAHNYASERFDSSVAATLEQSATYKQERDTAQASAAEKTVLLKELNAELKEKSASLASANSQLKKLNDQIALQQSQLSSNSQELEQLRSRPPLFSFQSQTGRDVSADEAAVREVVSAAYDQIVAVYGRPYILHQITISFVDSLTINGANGEIIITNSSEGLAITIKMIDFDKNSFADVNTIVHEIMHGFHGLAALNIPILEEGITVAATDVVMERLYQQGVISFGQRYISISDEQAAELNGSLPPPPASSALYSSPNVAAYYQLAGWAWSKLYAANPSFFINFNETLYNRVIKGESPNLATVKGIIGSSDFLASQIVFNPV